MKIIKFFITFVVAILLIGIIVFYYVQKSTLNNLEERKNNVTSLWEKFSKKLNERDKLILSVSPTNSDSLKYLIDKSKLNRKNSTNRLVFELYEYKLNKFLLDKCPDLETKTENLYRELNEITTEYNSSVIDYNIYYTMFPHFIFAKREGYKREKFLTIEYGKENQNPVEKSKEIPDWARDVDTTFLNE